MAYFVFQRRATCTAHALSSVWRPRCITTVAAWHNARRRLTSPALVMSPETSRAPDWLRMGVKPTHGPTFFEVANQARSSTVDRNVSASAARPRASTSSGGGPDRLGRVGGRAASAPPFPAARSRCGTQTPTGYRANLQSEVPWQPSQRHFQRDHALLGGLPGAEHGTAPCTETDLPWTGRNQQR